MDNYNKKDLKKSQTKNNDYWKYMDFKYII